MMPRMEVADVGRLYEQAAAERALVEIELDTNQLRAISHEEASAIIEDARVADGYGESSLSNDEFADSLEALLRLSWPVWKPNA